MSTAASVSALPGQVGLFPGIVTAQFVATCEFYFEHFGFRPIEMTEDYAIIGRGRDLRLGLLRAGIEEQPAALRQATRGAGMWLALVVDDPDGVHARLVAAGVEIVSGPEYTLSGTRRCIVRDPNGILVYVTQPGALASDSHSNNEENHDHDHSGSVYRVSGH